MQYSRKTTSEILVSIALVLLVIYIADIGVSTINYTGEGFLPLSTKDRGMIFGGGSIVLFLISFIVGLHIHSKVLTNLLIIGGAIMGTTVLISSFIMFPEDNIRMDSSSTADEVQILSPQFIGIIVIGYLIMGLEILRLIRKNNQNKIS